MHTLIAAVALVLGLVFIGPQSIALGIDRYECDLLTRSGPSCENPEGYYYGDTLDKKRAEYTACMMRYQSQMLACQQLYMQELIRMQQQAEMEQQSQRLMDMLRHYSGPYRW